MSQSSQPFCSRHRGFWPQSGSPVKGAVADSVPRFRIMRATKGFLLGLTEAFQTELHHHMVATGVSSLATCAITSRHRGKVGPKLFSRPRIAGMRSPSNGSPWTSGPRKGPRIHLLPLHTGAPQLLDRSGNPCSEVWACPKAPRNLHSPVALMEPCLATWSANFPASCCVGSLGAHGGHSHTVLLLCSVTFLLLHPISSVSWESFEVNH